MDINQLRFAKSHEWVAPNGSVGISDHAQKEITDVVFVELPQTGASFNKEQEAGAIESVKAAFPIYSPVGGKVAAVNEAISAEPGIINQSPYEKGWMFKLEISNPAELEQLMTHDQYQEFLRTESH